MNIEYTDNGCIKFECPYHKVSGFDNIVCRSRLEDCIKIKRIIEKISNCISIDNIRICNKYGKIELSWTDYIRYKGILNESKILR